jgi:hypothetical protein
MMGDDGLNLRSRMSRAPVASQEQIRSSLFQATKVERSDTGAHHTRTTTPVIALASTA